MARLYCNENFPQKAVDRLKALGHDALTTHEAGQSGKAIADPEVLAYAVREDRVLVTLNRKDFIALHGQSETHAGIIVCTLNTNFERLAEKIHEVLVKTEDVAGKLFKVTRDQEKE